MKKFFWIAIIFFSVILSFPLLSQEKADEEKLDKYLKILEKSPDNDFLFEKTWSLYQASPSRPLTVEYEKKLVEAPQDIALHLLISRFYLRQNENKKAIGHLEEIEKIRPGLPTTSYYLAEAYLANSEVEKAIASYEKAWPKTRNSKRKEEILTKLGRIYCDQNKHDLALKTWKEILKPTPTPAKIRTVTHLLLRYKHFQKEAEALLLQGIEKTPDLAEQLRLRHTLAQVQISQGKQEEALKNYEEILYRTQTNHWLREIALEEKRKIYIHTGKSAELAQYYIKRIGENKELEDYRELAKIYQETDDSRLSSLVKEAYNAHPQASYFFQLAIKIALEEKDFSQAIVVYERWLGDHPQDEKALRGLGEVYVKKGEPEKAFQTWKKMVQLNPTASGYLNFALLLRSYNMLSHSEKILDEGLSQFPQDLEFRVKSAQLLKEMSKGEKALQLLSQAPSSSLSAKELSDLYNRHGFYEKALEALDKEKEKNPETLWQMARNYMRLNQMEKAVEFAMMAYLLSPDPKKKPYYLEGTLGMIKTPKQAQLALTKIQGVENKIQKDGLYYFFLGSLHEILGEEEKALLLYQQSIQTNPKEILSHRRLAYLYSFSTPTKALSEYEILIQIDSKKSGEYLVQLARIYDSQNDAKKVDECYERISKISPLSREIFLEASGYYETRNLEKAIALLRRAKVEFPKDYQILKQHFILTKQKDPQEALSSLMEMLDSTMKDAEKQKEIKTLLVETCLEQGRQLLAANPPQWEKATSAFLQAESYSNPEQKTVVALYLLKTHLQKEKRSAEESKKVVELYQSLSKKQGNMVEWENHLSAQIYIILQIMSDRLSDSEKKSLQISTSIVAATKSAQKKDLPLQLPGPIQSKGQINYYQLSKPLVYKDYILLLDNQNLSAIHIPTHQEKKLLSVPASIQNHLYNFANYVRYNPKTNMSLMAIDGDILYLGGGDLKALSLKDLIQGKNHFLWQYTPPNSTDLLVIHKVLGNNLLVHHTGNQTLFCFDKSIGAIRWKRQATHKQRSPSTTSYYPYSYFQELPWIDGEKDFIVALYSDRMEKWKLGTGEKIWSHSLRGLDLIQKNLGFVLVDGDIYLPHRKEITLWDGQTGQSKGKILIEPSQNGSTPNYYNVIPLTAFEGKKGHLVVLHKLFQQGKGFSFELKSYDPKTLQVRWQKNFSVVDSNDYYGRFSLDIEGDYAYITSRYMQVFRLKDGESMGEDVIRKTLISMNVHSMYMLSSPLFCSDRIAFVDEGNSMFIYKKGNILSLTPPSSKISPDWDLLKLSESSKSLTGLFQKESVVALRLQEFSEDGGTFLQKLKACGSLTQILWDFQTIGEKYKTQMENLRIVFSDTLKRKFYVVYQPYFYRQKGLLGLSSWSLQAGPVIYLSSEAKKEILQGKIMESGFIQAFAQAYLLHIYGILNSSQFNPAKLMEMFSNPDAGNPNYLSTPYEAFIWAFGSYVEWSCFYSSEFKDSLIKALSNQNTYIYSTNNIRNQNFLQSLVLLHLEKESSPTDGRQQLIEVLFHFGPQRFGSFLEGYQQEYPKQKDKIFSSLKAILGPQVQFNPNYSFSDVLQDTEKSLRSMDRLLQKGFEKQMEDMEKLIKGKK